MKKVNIWFVVTSTIALVLVWFVSRPTPASFAVQHQEELEQFIALCRTEAVQPRTDGRLRDIYTDWNNKLVCGIKTFEDFDWEGNLPVSTELRSAWRRIRLHWYLTSVNCSFDDTGAVEVHFSKAGKWKPYAEGNYRICDCLVWRDVDYTRGSLEAWWTLLDESDGVSTSPEGGWYYATHKHYDG